MWRTSFMTPLKLVLNAKYSAWIHLSSQNHFFFVKIYGKNLLKLTSIYIKIGIDVLYYILNTYFNERQYAINNKWAICHVYNRVLCLSFVCSPILNKLLQIERKNSTNYLFEKRRESHLFHFASFCCKYRISAESIHTLVNGYFVAVYRLHTMFAAYVSQ